MIGSDVECSKGSYHILFLIYSKLKFRIPELRQYVSDIIRKQCQMSITCTHLGHPSLGHHRHLRGVDIFNEGESNPEGTAPVKACEMQLLVYP